MYAMLWGSDSRKGGGRCVVQCGSEKGGGCEMMRKVMVMLWVVISLPIVIVMVLFEALTKVFMDKKEKED